MIAPATITTAVPATVGNRTGLLIGLETNDGTYTFGVRGIRQIDAVYRAAVLPRALPPSALIGRRVSVVLAVWADGDDATAIGVLPYFKPTPGTSPRGSVVEPQENR